jgi:ribonuclease J
MKKLKVNILRGKENIGENLIEVSDKKTKILLECGVALEPTNEGVEIEKRVISTAYDAVIITHYHHDHSALLKNPLKAEKIYISNGTLKILEYCKGICEENKQKIEALSNRQPFSVGEMICKPYLCDHSAYDSYMIEISKGEENLLYTGDFRSNGRKNFNFLLKKLPKKVDLLITEATCPTLKNQTEKELEEKAVEIFSKYDKVFILQSTLNIDRTVSFYRASKRTDKPFIMGLSSADICSNLLNIPSPKTFEDCFTYFNMSLGDEFYATAKSKYKTKLLGRSQIAKKDKFTMQINAGMLGYLKKISEIESLKNNVLIYSMWQGYKAEMQEFLDGVKEMGVNTVDLHVSGHADLLAIEQIIIRTNPKKIELVHTKEEDSFLWEALLLRIKAG